MDYPVIFPLRERLLHRSSDYVRHLCQANGFTRHKVSRSSILRHPTMRGFSEIWFRLAGRGYAVIRIDDQGHARLADRESGHYEIGGVAPGPHGAVPHYHKEWITAELFFTYLQSYVRQVVRYNDAGDPVTAAMTDGTAKAVHIKG